MRYLVPANLVCAFKMTSGKIVPIVIFLLTVIPVACMGGCCVPRCNSSSTKGHLLKVFPKDSVLRQKWLEKVDRGLDWKPIRPLICALHFEESQWSTESNCKLNVDAVPTQFCCCPKDGEAVRYAPSEHAYSGNQRTSKERTDHSYFGNKTTSNGKKKSNGKFMHIDRCPLSRSCKLSKNGSTKIDKENSQGNSSTQIQLRSPQKRVPLATISFQPTREADEKSFLLNAPLASSSFLLQRPTFEVENDEKSPSSEHDLTSGIFESSSCILQDVQDEDIFPPATPAVASPKQSRPAYAVSSIPTTTEITHAVASSSPQRLNLGAPSTSQLSVQQLQETANVLQTITTKTLAAATSSPQGPNLDAPSISQLPVQDSSRTANVVEDTLFSELLKLSPKKKDNLLRKLLTENRKLKNAHQTLRRNNNTLRVKVKRLEDRLAISENFRTSFLGDKIPADRVKALGRKSTRGVKWSSESIYLGLKEWFACGTHGYRNHSLPQPSIRVLQKSIEHIHFNPGIQDVVFETLPAKTETLPREHQVCALGVDEMELVQACDWDPSTKSYIGECTLSGDVGLASKAMVFILAGLLSRWKQLVAYHFTGKRSNPLAVRDVIFEIIRRCHAIGLTVLCIISDMGMRGAWAAMGFSSTKDCMVYKIPHPCGNPEWLYVVPDTVHLQKNAVHMLSVHREFILSDDIVQEQGLSSNIVAMSDVEAVAKHQEGKDVKIVPKLNESILDASKFHYAKMDVHVATSIVSWPVVIALTTLSAILNKAEMLTTAWMFEVMFRWFKICTGRDRKNCLNKANKQAYETHIAILNLATRVFSTLKISKEWKPVQTGIIMATKALLEMQQLLMDQFGFDYVLLGRITQDFVENFFSLIRQRRPVPTPVQFKQTAKQLTLMQFINPSKKTKYYNDSRKNLVFDELVQPEKRNDRKRKVYDNEPEDHAPPPKVNRTMKMSTPIVQEELAVLYRMAGYIAQSMKKQKTVCQTCFTCLLHRGAAPLPYASVIRDMNFAENAQVEVSEELFQSCLHTEKVIRDVIPTVQMGKNVIAAVMEKAQPYVKLTDIPKCHPCIYQTFIERWVGMRIKQYSSLATKRHRSAVKASKGQRRKGSKFLSSAFASRSMGSRLLAENLII